MASLLSDAAGKERHFAGDPAGVLYQKSIFAHGFIHGYEDGFCLADQYYQMGRLNEDATSARQYKEASGGYQRAFGDKKRFKDGYREGFRAGFADSMNNRNFRAVPAARDASAGLAPLPHDQIFEDGFVSGYRAGGTETNMVLGAEACIVPQNTRSTPNSDYCDGYQRGLQFANLLRASSSGGIQTASKR